MPLKICYLLLGRDKYLVGVVLRVKQVVVGDGDGDDTCINISIK